MEIDTNKIIKICIIGSTSLKTRMVYSFIGSKGYVGEESPFGVELSVKQLKINEHIHMLFILDVGWSLKRSCVIHPDLIWGANVCVITFDKGVAASLEVVNDWYKNLRKIFLILVFRLCW
ncbi:MAG: hypothetical protein ACXADY_10540 [Candidatus Hodarchaeales archaeon]|jgi:predicted Kef-type K+ transport protein